MRINNNATASAAYSNLSIANKTVQSSIEKLSSGFRINRAADDAAGLVISEKLRSQIGGTKVATRNAQDGISLVQTADGALTEVSNMLQRMRDLVLHHSNGATDADAKVADEAEFDQLVTEIQRIFQSTSFARTKLFGDSTAGPVQVAPDLDFYVGANGTDFVKVDFSAAGMDIDFGQLGIATGDLALVTPITVTDIDTALDSVTGWRGNLGALQNRFDHTINNLNNALENLTAAESRIRDTDMAQEMTVFTKAQILSQASTAMLAQANAMPQSVLSLLQ